MIVSNIIPVQKIKTGVENVKLRNIKTETVSVETQHEKKLEKFDNTKLITS